MEISAAACCHLVKVGERRRSGLECHSRGVRREADGVVPAAQHVDVEELVVGEFGTELIMVRGVDRGVVVERVGGADEESVSFVGPAGVVRRRRG